MNNILRATGPGWVTSLIVCVFPALAFGLSPDTVDPVLIMDAMSERDTGNRQTATMTIVVEDDAGRRRTRVLKTRTLQSADKSKTWQLMRFESPADVRGTTLLTHDFKDGAKQDDQWLYLPALKKPTRIASSEKSGSFMGTDLSYSDMTNKDSKDYTLAVLKPSVTIAGEVCWLIEARPKTAKAKEETGYLKTKFWISKRMLAPVQAKMWVREGKKLKYLKFSGYKEFKSDGKPFYVATRIRAWTKRNKNTESTTELTFTDLKFDQPSVKRGDFDPSRL